MLKEIYVKDFILIDELHLSFDERMSAFTGETGAGKSLLMDAIGALKGERMSTTCIREGKDKALVEGVFEVRKQHVAYSLLVDAGMDVEACTFVASRECLRSGKSIARINQRVVNVSFLREVVSSLVDIHSQHDTQYLLNAKYHITLLDQYGKNEALCTRVAQLWKTYRGIRDELESIIHQDYNEDDVEFLTYQLNEIDDANMKEEELTTLEDEQRRMQAFGKIVSNVQNALQLLEGEHGNASLYQAAHLLTPLHEDTFFIEEGEKLEEAYYQIEDTISTIKEHVETLSFDEAHFNLVQERIFLLHKILRKYGPTYQALMQTRQKLEANIDRILHREDFIKKQEVICKQAQTAYEQEAKKLHVARVTSAQQLQKQILAQLQALQLPNARFEVAIEDATSGASGMDRVIFMVAMNPGEGMRPLNTSASGGELSRFMLGLKTVFTSLQGIETIIFDEIDTGVSGSVALCVGRKMKELAKQVQVFCVTHLAAVAACSDQHFIVEKKQSAHTTTTSIHKLTTQERIKELAMISNNATSDSALLAAKELLEKAQSE